MRWIASRIWCLGGSRVSRSRVGLYTVHYGLLYRLHGVVQSQGAGFRAGLVLHLRRSRFRCLAAATTSTVAAEAVVRSGGAAASTALIHGSSFL